MPYEVHPLDAEQAQQIWFNNLSPADQAAIKHRTFVFRELGDGLPERCEHVIEVDSITPTFERLEEIGGMPAHVQLVDSVDGDPALAAARKWYAELTPRQQGTICGFRLERRTIDLGGEAWVVVIEANGTAAFVPQGLTFDSLPVSVRTMSSKPGARATVGR